MMRRPTGGREEEGSHGASRTDSWVSPEWRVESGHCQVLALRSSVVEVVEVVVEVPAGTVQPPLGSTVLQLSQITSGSADCSEDRPSEGS